MGRGVQLVRGEKRGRKRRGEREGRERGEWVSRNVDVTSVFNGRFNTV